MLVSVQDQDTYSTSWYVIEYHNMPKYIIAHHTQHIIVYHGIPYWIMVLHVLVLDAWHILAQLQRLRQLGDKRLGLLLSRGVRDAHGIMGGEMLEAKAESAGDECKLDLGSGKICEAFPKRPARRRGALLRWQHKSGLLQLDGNLLLAQKLSHLPCLASNIRESEKQLQTPPGDSEPSTNLPELTFTKTRSHRFVTSRFA